MMSLLSGFRDDLSQWRWARGHVTSPAVSDGSSKALVTVASGPMGSILDVSGRTFRRYAERHGYEFIVGTGDAQGRPPAWAKVPLLRRLLDTYDTVLWIDADAVILNGETDIAAELQPGDYQGFAPTDGEPNTGVWLLRGDRAKQFLDAVWAETAFIDHCCWEQAAAMHLLGYPVPPVPPLAETSWNDGTRRISNEWNAMHGTNGARPRIRHYPGQNNPYRIRRLKIDVATTDETLKGPLKILAATARLAASRERRRHY